MCVYIYIAILYSKYQTSESRGAPRGRSPRPHHSTARISTEVRGLQRPLRPWHQAMEWIRAGRLELYGLRKGSRSTLSLFCRVGDGRLLGLPALGSKVLDQLVSPEHGTVSRHGSRRSTALGSRGQAGSRKPEAGAVSRRPKTEGRMKHQTPLLKRLEANFSFIPSPLHVDSHFRPLSEFHCCQYRHRRSHRQWRRWSRRWCLRHDARLEPKSHRTPARPS